MKKLLTSSLLCFACIPMGLYSQDVNDQSENYFSGPEENSLNITPYADISEMSISLSPQAILDQAVMSHNIAESAGLPNIHIPLYTMEIDGLEIPVSLIYNGRGIKYKQFDGEIAAGWSLSIAGYQVTRQIYGNPDERSTSADWDIDQFSYCLPSSYGMFIKDVTQSTNTRVFSQNRDQVSMPDLRRLQIRDTNGFIYSFGSGSPTYPYIGDVVTNTASRYYGYPTKLCLTSIITPLTKQTINFSYKPYTSIVDAYWQGSLTFTTTSTNGTITSTKLSVDEGEKLYSQTFYVEQITTPKEIVKFTRDLAGVLLSITVNDLTGSCVKKFNMEYETIGFHRLLSGVTLGNENASYEKYKMNYHVPGYPIDISKVFPDTWGYYTYLSSYTPGTSLGGPVDKGIYIHEEFLNDEAVASNRTTTGALYPNAKNYAAPRHISGGATSLYSLTSITYPTGELPTMILKAMRPHDIRGVGNV
ncbi:MAG: hypothetical protein LUD76_09420 [Alistipes sp.]|nr:hypothetical protein [Alistipes sp.]